MPSSKYSLPVIAAAKKTVEAYQKLIADPARIRYWRSYGSTNSCRLCNAVGSDRNGNVNCSICPLADPESHDGTCPCSTRSGFESYDDFTNVTECSKDKQMIITTAAARLAFIMNRFRENGVELTF
jgi:hypothetical protein